MTKIGCITPIVLTEEEQQEYRDFCASIRPITQRWSLAAYDTDSVKRFRRDYLAGDLAHLPIPEEDQEGFRLLEQAAEVLLAGHVRYVRELARTFHVSKSHRTAGFWDFFQEGCMAVLDCVWGFDGSKCFSTYMTFAVKNRFLDLVRVDNFLTAVSPNIRQDRQAVQEVMSNTGCTFDDAIEQLGLDENRARSVSRASAQVYPDTAMPEVESEPDLPEDEELPKLRLAIKETNLSPVERQALNAYLSEDPYFQVIKDQKMSRQSVNQALNRAKDKVADTFLRLRYKQVA